MIRQPVLADETGTLSKLSRQMECLPSVMDEQMVNTTAGEQLGRSEACTSGNGTIPIVRTPIVLIEPNREPVVRQRPIRRERIDPAVLEFLRRIHAKIAEAREYPPNAITLGLQGTATVKLIVMPDGHAHALRIRKSSGHDMLDDAALEAVQKVLPLKPPPEAGNRPLELDIPISFALR